MKHRPTLLVLVALGLAAFGCDPAPKDEPTAPSSSAAKTAPNATSPQPGTPKTEEKTNP